MRNLNSLFLIRVYVFADSNIVISNGASMKIINASKNDAGNYTCTAHNSIGDTQRQFRVDVLQKPRILRGPVSKSSPPSSTVRLDCSAEGTPEPKIIWLKNGEPLNYTARIKRHSKGLLFSHTFKSDSGEFVNFFSQKKNLTDQFNNIFITCRFLSVSCNQSGRTSLDGCPNFN